ncbi:MAG: hypothetical protein MJY47_06030 [Fibrobacter sp.]|nr:hypothetical protein [Fibrobacter sp.]
MRFQMLGFALWMTVCLLAGCAASGPAPAVVQESVANQESTAPQKSAAPQKNVQSPEAAATQESAVLENAKAEDTAASSSSEGTSSDTAVPTSAASAVVSSDTNALQSQEMPEPASSTPSSSEFVDPYVAVPALIETIFANADSLYKQGLTDSAIAYVERFRIIKPLWTSWETLADSLRVKFGKTRAEQSKKFEPLVLEIQNMNRAQSAYSMVAAAVDSLISLSPGDSLVGWAALQKKTAFDNTLAKAKKEKDEIWNLADVQGQFEKAVEQAKTFQMRYRDFEDSLQIADLIAKIQALIGFRDLEANEFWNKNDPNAKMASVDSLIKVESFAEAKKLLELLKYSTLRAEAVEKYKGLADAYCNKERKTTSQIFAKAQKQKDVEKKRQLLNDAVAPLDRCLAEFPEYSQRGKVLDNKNFLLKELAK